MNRRKGELTPSAIDRGWPFQIAPTQELSSGKLYAEQMEFCEKQKLMRCVRGHSVFPEDKYLQRPLLCDEGGRPSLPRSVRR